MESCWRLNTAEDDSEFLIITFYGLQQWLFLESAFLIVIGWKILICLCWLVRRFYFYDWRPTFLACFDPTRFTVFFHCYAISKWLCLDIRHFVLFNRGHICKNKWYNHGILEWINIPNNLLSHKWVSNRMTEKFIIRIYL